MDGEKWWSKKLEGVRDKSRKWTALFRAGYFGRNLVVQSMFLGRLRYWLYSVPMSKKIRNRYSLTQTHFGGLKNQY